MRRGRPLRFLAVVLGGWTVTRVVALWPNATIPDVLARASASPRSPGPEITTAATPFAAKVFVTPSSASAAPHAPRKSSDALAGALPVASPAPTLVQDLTEAGPDVVPLATASTTDVVAAPLPDAAAPSRSLVAPPRLAGGTWFVARGGATGDSLAFGQLGASQAGVRLTYAIDRTRRIALSARASAPLRGSGREAAVGLDWQPTPLPIHLLVEQRLQVDGGGGRPAVQLIAGAQTRLPLGLSLDGYAQAGAIRGRGGFADGAAHLVRPLLTSGNATLDIGAGGWGAAQRGVWRVDVGPTLGLTMPIQGVGVRVAVDYRARVAGRARPGSGPALSVGTGF